MQTIDVLRDQQALRDASLDIDEGVVRRIRLHSRNELAAPRIPIPNELGVNRKRGWGRKLQRIESRPQAGLRIAKRRHPGFGGDASPGQHRQRARAGKCSGGVCRGSALLGGLHHVEGCVCRRVGPEPRGSDDKLLLASWRRRPLFPGRSRIRPMSGNTFGRLFCVTSFGESHGPAIGCVVDGCPPGLLLETADIQRELDRRKPGTSRHVTQRREADTVEILSGVFEGRTTGTPIALLIRNEDARSKDYAAIADTFRPGHADYTYWQKYGIRDHRGGGRQSARETAVRVAAGAVARKWLREKYGVVIRGYLSQLGPKRVPFKGWEHVDANPFFVAKDRKST